MIENKNKFKEGDTVYAKVNPKIRLIVRRYVSRIYYCKFANQPDKKELAFFERELVQ